MADPGERLRRGLERARERTMLLVEPLDEAALRRAPSPIMSPPVWDLGHIAAYEELWLVRRLTGAPSLHPELESVYDAFETPRARRTDVPILDPAEAHRYLDEVRLRALEALERADLSEDGPELTAGGMVFDMVIQHEAQHTETILQALQLFPAGVYTPPCRRPVPRPAAGAGAGMVLVPGGPFAMGAGNGRFAYDCERPRHVREVGPFLIGRLPVTCGEHLAFMADGGYRRPELWSGEGWVWREREGVEAPLYWERDGAGGWVQRRFDRVESVDPGLPVCHVSFYEAEAHARWAGARLPTEAEWERAAAWDPDRGEQRLVPWGDGGPEGRANLDQLAFGPAPAGAYPEGAAPSGCLGVLGDVWEWTQTTFDGYPGFRAFPYREYAEVFFGDRYRVLRGGSWATQPDAVRTTFRNWDLPYRRQIFAGFRLARDLPDGPGNGRAA